MTRTLSPKGELYLVLKELQHELPQYLLKLLPLDQYDGSKSITGVECYYQQEQDLALLRLNLKADTSPQHVVEVAREAGVPVMEPSRLSRRDQEVFHRQFLSRFSLRIDQYQSPLIALDALAKALGVKSEFDEETAQDDSYVSAKQVDAPRVVEEPLRARALGSHHDEDEILLEIDDDDFDERNDAPAQAPRMSIDLGPAGRSALPPEPPKASPNVAALPLRARPLRDSVAAQANAKESEKKSKVAPRSERAGTLGRIVPKRQRDETVLGRRRHASPPSESFASGSFDDTTVASDPPSAGVPSSVVNVEYQRGDRWHPARLRNLTMKEALLAVSAPPGVGSHIEVSVCIDDFGTTLNGKVVECIDCESDESGIASMRVELGSMEIQKRVRLMELLRMAKRRGLSLTPPPPRRSRRFSVSWPIQVWCDGDSFRASAIDISDRGFYLASSRPIQETMVRFSLELDSESKSIEGDAMIVRHIDVSTSVARGLTPGYGLQIRSIDIEKQDYFQELIWRIRQRSERHIVVLGQERRAQHLAESFQAAGYAVSRVATLNALQKRLRQPGPPDLAVVDEESALHSRMESLDEALQDYGVPNLKLASIPLLQAREAVDRAVLS